MVKTNLRKSSLIYPELSYQIIGVLFEVWTRLESGHKEKIYENAAAEEFKSVKLEYKEQLPVKIYYKNKLIGMYYFDFLIEDKVVLEIKVRNYFSNKDIA